MKRSSRSLSKKGLVGLKRLGTIDDRHWLYKGTRYETLREVIRAARQ